MEVYVKFHWVSLFWKCSQHLNRPSVLCNGSHMCTPPTGSGGTEERFTQRCIRNLWILSMDMHWTRNSILNSIWQGRLASDTDFMLVKLRVCDSKVELKKRTSHNMTAQLHQAGWSAQKQDSLKPEPKQEQMPGNLTYRFQKRSPDQKLDKVTFQDFFLT